tara:strand:+ start:65 stop:508 length:444 start_codon:yes stop_codon:yes gene_type:complete
MLDNKKITILLSLLISSIAWTEPRTLECEYYSEPDEMGNGSYTYIFDPELPNGEMNGWGGTEFKVNVYPNSYKLTWERGNADTAKTPYWIWRQEHTVEISRVDLSYKHIKVEFKAECCYDKQTESKRQRKKATGQCKFVENIKENLF